MKLFESLYSHNYTVAAGHPRWVAIDEIPPLEFGAQPLLSPGDLVVWANLGDCKREGNWYHSKSVGTVLETRWCLADWMQLEGKAMTYFAEAVVTWCDGDITYTAQACLRNAAEKEKSHELQ